MDKSKFIALMLLFVIIILSACSNISDGPANNISGPEENAGNTAGGDIAEETSEEKPDIPITDMDGKEIRIFTSGWYGFGPLAIVDIDPEEFLGEPLNDAAYTRKILIEDTYNCKIAQINVDVPAEAASAFQRSIRTQDNAYDIGVIRGDTFALLLTGGYLRELNDLEHVDFDNPWWRKKAFDALALGGKHYGVCGDMSTNEMMTVPIVCFNKGIVQDHALESPYMLVETGEWTFDKAVEMAKQIARDLNGDGKMTIEDLWGILYTHDEISSILQSGGVGYIELEPGGIPQIAFDSAANISRMQNIFEKIFDETYSGNLTVRLAGGGDIFGEQRCLFWFAGTHRVNALRQMDVDFGIIPYPKYSRDQEYRPHVIGRFVPVICVPSTNPDMGNTGLFMEAFAYEGNKSIIPVFYETILQGKVVRDDESADMIDFIFGNLHYDAGSLLNVGNMAIAIDEMSVTLNMNIASFVEKNKPNFERALKKIMDEIEKNN